MLIVTYLSPSQHGPLGPLDELILLSLPFILAFIRPVVDRLRGRAQQRQSRERVRMKKDA
jgi:hypothetical protein